MPIYEYKCKKCGRTSSYIEKIDEFRILRRKCAHCGSRKTKKVMSGFSTSTRTDMPTMINELKKYGPVNFVPGAPPVQGPPPGGCPYSSQNEESGKGEK